MRPFLGAMRQKRSVLAAAVVVATAVLFWTQSRIPALDRKALMGVRSDAGPLNFDVILPVEEGMPRAQRVLHTAANWGYTNWRGMTFGLVLAAALLALLGCLPRGRRGNRVVDAVKGALLGAPLGLCANCATPVSHGMYSGGVRPETALATMLASPTLNPIVLTMLFALFPRDVGATKVGLTLVLIVGVVPLLSRWTRARELAERRATQTPEASRLGRWLGAVPIPEFCRVREPEPASDETWSGALRTVGGRLLQSAGFVAKSTVPLMILAGLLGAAAIELLPLTLFDSVEVGVPSLLFASLLGTFLPVPMAFDVIAVAMLVARGLPLPLGATLLFTLSMFSVFPFIVIWRTLSRSLAAALYGSVSVLGVAAGLVVHAREGESARAVRDAFEETATDLDREAVTLARAACAEVSDPRACVKTFVLRRLASGGGGDLCDGFSRDAEFHRGCTEMSRFEDAIRRGVALRDPVPCADLSDPADVGNCRNLVIEQAAVNDLQLHLDLCAVHEAPGDVAQCRVGAVREWILPRGDETLCKYLTDAQDVEACRRFADVARLILDRDLDGCRALDPARASFCEGRVRASWVREAADAPDEGACESLPGPELTDECRREWVLRQARGGAEIGVCDRLEGEPRDACRLESVLRRVEREVARRTASAFPVPEAGAEPQAAATRVDPAEALPVEVVRDDAELRVTASRRRDRSAATAEPFERLEGPALGLDPPWDFGAPDFREPMVVGRGIASGDWNGDGWTDLVVASARGAHLFRNVSGRFVLESTHLPAPDAASVFAVALADFDDDGRLDLYTTTYGGGIFVALADREGFLGQRTIRLPDRGASLTFASAIGDVDGDGDLDVVAGNWSFGSEKGFVPARSANLVYRNDALAFRPEPLPEVPGETLSVLLSDVHGDSRPELFVGNDHDRPDQYYRIGDRSRFERLEPRRSPFPVTPFHTMSIDSADFDNDLRLDLFSADMEFKASARDDYCAGISDARLRGRCRDALALEPLVRNRDVEGCRRLSSPADRRACVVAVLIELAVRTRDPGLCADVPDAFGAYRALCQNLAGEARADGFRQSEHLPQRSRNVLLMATPEGRFEDRAEAMGVALSRWSWNARAADLDDDGWQDIYVGTGYRFETIHSNVFFHNRGGGAGFVERQDEFGLDDYLATPSYAYLDLEGDGDLDIVATAVAGPLRVFRNGGRSGRSLQIRLLDHRGNRFGIGSRITIEYALGRLRQTREIKLGGGFLSFDDPVAHFGLGDHAVVERVRVRWSTGETSEVEGPLAAGSLYTIERKSPSAPGTPGPP